MDLKIIGGGLVGSLLSIYLRKRGINVEVFEKRPNILKNGEEKGRSINMALSDRGWMALKKIELDETVRKNAIPMYGRLIHHKDGTNTFQPYGKNNQAIYSISRNLLTKILIEESVSLGTPFHFNQKCIDIDLFQKHLIFEEYETKDISKFTYDILIGADGANSEVRNTIVKAGRYDYHQWYLKHGYKELSIPAQNGSHLLEKNALHIWPRGEFMLIALPNIDGSFTCTLFLPFDGEISFSKIKSSTDLLVFFKTYFPDAHALMPSLEEDYFHNPLSSLINVSCWPWSYNNSVLVMGDAAHSIVPFYGQGMNAGFEDVRIFDELLETPELDLHELFMTFEQSRKPNTDAIAQMALDNFLEMSQKVADESFIIRKKIDALLHEKYGHLWLPQYTMVTFSPDLSYSDAFIIGKKQTKILDEIMKTPDIEKLWETLNYDHFLR